MAELIMLENGIKKTANGKRRKKRRNPTVSKTTTVVKRSNGIKRASNPKRRKRRNGLVTRSRNGLLGNTKSDAKTVGGLIGGGFATKLISETLQNFVSPYAAQSGIPNSYVELGLDLVGALFVVPFAVGKMFGSDVAKSARWGGLMVFGIDAINTVAPNALSWNPFNTTPIVTTASGGAAIAPQTVAVLAQAVADSPNPQAEAAKIAGAMWEVDTAMPVIDVGGQMPMFDQ